MIGGGMPGDGPPPAAMGKSSRDWISVLNPRPNARLRLYCLPFAGGGAAMFRSWPGELPADIEVCPIQLPGREARFHEPRFTRIPQLVRTLAPVMLPHLQKPFAILGHSMGGLIAFELLRELRRLGAPPPQRLLVSGRQAPQIVNTDPPLHGLPAGQFFDELDRRYGGVPTEALNNPEIREVFVALLRADIEMVESYRYLADAPLDCPISVFGGRHDLVSESDLSAWQEHTRPPLTVTMFEGSHFFIQTARVELLRVIGQHLAAG
ncbi:MAG: alpha/beta fold hydrolase [Acidobacteriota bacterium]|nr:alpha/beta fold hydrolase [Acidobacteriota bacterium]